MQRGAIREGSRQHGITAAPLSLQGRERGAYRLTQAATDTDTVPVRGRITARTGHVLTTHAAGPGVRRPALAGLPLLFIDPASLAQSLRTFLSVRRVSRHRIIDVIEPAVRQAQGPTERPRRGPESDECRRAYRSLRHSTSGRGHPRAALIIACEHRPSREQPSRCGGGALPGVGRTQITSMMRCHLTPPDASLVHAGKRHRKKIASRLWALPRAHL